MGKISGLIDEASGYAKEEWNEDSDPAAAAEGRAQRNKGLIEQGKTPKVTPVGADD